MNRVCACVLGLVLAGQAQIGVAAQEASTQGGMQRLAPAVQQAAPGAEPRDPTAMPLQAQQVVPEGAHPALHLGNSVVMQNGNAFLVVGTRLVAVGQKVGSARLERITETDIWLREAGRLTKVPRFVGIERRAALATSACTQAVPSHSSGSTAAASRTRSATRAASCDGAQP